MGLKLSTKDLHIILLRTLDPYVEKHSDIESKPLMIKLKPPHNISINIYIFNCTNPPGARQAGEYKSQLILPGQKRWERGQISDIPGAVTLLMGFASIVDNIEEGIFVIWELAKHKEFAYSANVQVALSTLMKAYTLPMFDMKKRGNGEVIVVCRPQYLIDGIVKRIDIDIQKLLED